MSKSDKKELVNMSKLIGAVVLIFVAGSVRQSDPGIAGYLLGVSTGLLCSWFVTFGHSGLSK